MPKGRFLREKDPLAQPRDFLALMGAQKGVWKWLISKRDRENLAFFRAIYEQHKLIELEGSGDKKIPQVIHFIWLGPTSFPKSSLPNVASWIDHHSDWTFNYWTDRKRPLPHPKMEEKLIFDHKLDRMRSYLKESDSYAEQSDLLRYEILYREGGVYVDHDVECFRSFAPFHAFDLYCALEVPHRPILKSSISICNNLIGARQGHRALKRCLELVEERWRSVGDQCPGKDRDSVAYRVAQRTFVCFEDGVKEEGNQEGSRDMVLPAGYFNRIEGDFALYAHHEYASTWLRDETVFECATRRRLIALSRKQNKLLLIGVFALFIALLSLIIQMWSLYR